MDAKRRPLTERQIEVLAALDSNYRHNSGSRNNGDGGPRWSTPMDFGGRDGSHHSATATQLAKRGLVDRYKLGDFTKGADGTLTDRLNNFKSRRKGSCCYRITEAGREALASATRA